MPDDCEPSAVVLVVEDDWLLATTIADELRSRDCQVLEAAAGEAALAFLDGARDVDVLFSDLNLGDGIGGGEVAEAFRKADPQIGIVFTSGHRSPPLRHLPGSLFIEKPYDPAEIGEACLRMARTRKPRLCVRAAERPTPAPRDASPRDT